MKQDLVRLIQKLIQIDSQNPPGDEKKIGLFIKKYLKERNLECKTYEFKRNRLNVVCSIPSKKRKKKLIITPHIDTVPAGEGWKIPPFSGYVSRDRIYGRGATDCKSNVAAALYVIHELRKEKVVFKNLDLIFAFTADEETGSEYGIKPLIKYLKNIDYGLVLDSDEMDIVIAQKGLLHLRVEVFGKEAHGAYPERGVNAVEKSVRALNDILSMEFRCKYHSLLKKPTLNIGRFGGGEKVNIVAGYASFDLDIRFLPSMKSEKIIMDIKKILSSHQCRYKITVLAQQEPVEVDKNSFSLRTLKQSLVNNRIIPKLKPSFGATVINFLRDEGIETFAFGFGTKGCAHIKNEYVVLKNVYDGVRVLKDYFKLLDNSLNDK